MAEAPPLSDIGLQRIQSVTLVQRDVEPSKALSVSREWTDRAYPDEEIRLGLMDADCVHVHLNPAPASTLYVNGRTTIVPARGLLESSLHDLRPELRWPVSHSMHRVAFAIPTAATRRWAEEAGVRRFSGLIYVDGEGRHDETLKSFALALLPSLEQPEKASALFVDYILNGVCGYLAQTFGAAQPKPVRRGGLAPWQERRAKEMMAEGLKSQVSLKELADECRLSVSHFVKAFRETTGLTPHQWLLECRIDRAIGLMSNGDMSLLEISAVCGFADQSHFTRAFSKSVGIAPGAWKRAGGSRSGGGRNVLSIVADENLQDLPQGPTSVAAT